MNPNLLIATTDWHLVETDTSPGIAGDPTRPTGAAQVVAYINQALAPAGVIDCGDCKDHYGVVPSPEHDRYIEKVRSQLPWLPVADGTNADYPILPGNHDELNDLGDPGSDFSPFDGKFWAAPYHWTADWQAPRIRVIGIHSRMVHPGEGNALPYTGFAAVAPEERQWLRDQLAALPVGWQAIICSHFPLNPAFGANIGHWPWLTAYGGAELQQIVRDNASKVCAYLNGHRHGNMETNVLDGVRHFNLPGMSYTIGNGYGGFAPITYDAEARTLTFDFLKGPPSTFQRMPGFTPVVVQLPALPIDPPPPDPDPGFTFTATGTVTIDGVEHTATLTGTGALT